MTVLEKQAIKHILSIAAEVRDFDLYSEVGAVLSKHKIEAPQLIRDEIFKGDAFKRLNESVRSVKLWGEALIAEEPKSK